MAFESFADEGHVGSEQREDDPEVVPLQPRVVRALRVAGERVEQAGGEHAEHVGDQLEHDGRHAGGVVSRGPVREHLEQVVAEDEEAGQVGPDVHRLVVKPEPTIRKSMGL